MKKVAKGEVKDGCKKVVRQLLDEGGKPAHPFNSILGERRRMVMRRRMLKKTRGRRKALEDDSQMLSEDIKEGANVE